MSNYDINRENINKINQNVSDTQDRINRIVEQKKHVQDAKVKATELKADKLTTAGEKIKSFGQNLEGHAKWEKGFWKTRKLWNNGVYKNAGKSREKYQQKLQVLGKKAEAHQKKIQELETRAQKAEVRIERLKKVSNRILDAQTEIKQRVIDPNYGKINVGSLKFDNIFTTSKEKLLENAAKNLNAVEILVGKAFSESIEVRGELDNLQREINEINKEAEEIENKIQQLSEGTRLLGEAYVKISQEHKEVIDEITNLETLSQGRVLSQAQGEIIEKGLTELREQQALLEGLLEKTEHPETLDKLLVNSTINDEINGQLKEIHTRVVGAKKLVEEAFTQSIEVPTKKRSVSFFEGIARTKSLFPVTARRGTIDTTYSIKNFRKNQVETHVQAIQQLGREVSDIKRLAAEGEISQKDAVKIIKNKIEEVKTLEKEIGAFEEGSVQHKRIEAVKDKITEDLVEILERGLSKEARKYSGQKELHLRPKDDIIDKYHKEGSEEDTINQYFDRKSKALEEYFTYVRNKSEALGVFAKTKGEIKRSATFKREVEDQLLQSGPQVGQLLRHSFGKYYAAAEGLKSSGNEQAIEKLLTEAYSHRAQVVENVLKTLGNGVIVQQLLIEVLDFARSNIVLSAGFLVIKDDKALAAGSKKSKIQELKQRLPTLKGAEREIVEKDIKSLEGAVEFDELNVKKQEEAVGFIRLQNRAFVNSLLGLEKNGFELTQDQKELVKDLQELDSSQDYHHSLSTLSGKYKTAAPISPDQIRQGLITSFSILQTSNYQFKDYDPETWKILGRNLQNLGAAEEGQNAQLAEQIIKGVSEYEQIRKIMSEKFGRFVKGGSLDPNRNLSTEDREIITQLKERISKLQSEELTEGVGTFGKVAEDAKQFYLESLKVDFKYLGEL